MNTKNLIKIISDLTDVCKATDVRPSDDILLDCAVRIHNSEQIEFNKQGKKTDNSQKSTSFQTSSPATLPATKKAINYLISLGYTGDTNLTKEECWRLTQDFKKK